MATKDIMFNENQDELDATATDSGVVSWVMSRVQDWEEHRETNFKDRWNEYYRLWRGVWDAKDKNRDSERSRLIAPSLSQAVEATVAELEEATFGGGKWFDVDDNFADDDKTDIAMFRDQLKEDLEAAGVPVAMAEVFMNGCIYGTGIGKITLSDEDKMTLVASPIDGTFVTDAEVSVEKQVEVGLVAVHPQEFVIDPAALTINDALGMAHITVVPKHIVVQKQKDEIYSHGELGDFSDTLVGNKTYDNRVLDKDSRHRDSTMIVEYHGLIPRELLPLETDEDEIVVSLLDNEESVAIVDEDDMVESIVTIANGHMLLRAIENPNIMKDRAFIAYPHDKVPNEFWGRGVCEKGYNPQKALDSEMRGRIDAMALAIVPMVGVDATRMVRGANFKIQPGRNILTNGDPSTVLKPFQFGQVSQHTFAQSGELERMVQMATGAMDSATPIGENRRNETSSGMSMIMSGAIKRSKRTLSNIERLFTKPFIHKAAWRFMQYAPDRYPAKDVKFKVIATMGLVARELEQQTFSSMMNTVPAESPAFWMLLKGVYENSSMSNREEMLPIIDQMMQKSLQQQAQPPQPDPMVALKQQELQLKAKMEQAKLQMSTQDNQQDAQLNMEKLKLEYEKLKLKREEMILDAQIALAAQEQDSAVTMAQMTASQQQHSEKCKLESEKHKATATARQPSSAPAPAAAPAEPVVINTGPVTNVAAPEKSGKKKISIKRTKDGLEGSLTEEK